MNKRKTTSVSAEVSVGDTLAPGSESIVECPICWNEMAQRKPQSLPCGHLYCNECLETCCINRDFKMCPICKKRFKNQDQ